MKRLITPMILFLAGSMTLHGQSVNNVSVNVAIRQDGSATVTQNWDVEVVRGTEWYLPVKNLRGMTVSDLRVYENGREFISEGNDWDVDRSLEAKRGRCGINITGDGVELCWGQGDYGRHEWTAVFRLCGLVQSLNDYDAFIFQFINPGLVAAPDSASVTIVNESGTPWTYDNTRVWGFGFDGEINLVDGKIVAAPEDGLTDNGHMTIMVRFDKGIFAPTISRDMDFSEMESQAKDGSSYYEDDAGDWISRIFALLCFAVPFLTLIYAAICKALGFKYKKSYFGQSKITGWHRTAPLDGDLFSSYHVLRHGKRFGAGPSDANHLIGALFLKWVLEGKVKARPDGSRVNLDFTGEADIENNVERDLYIMARAASGENYILEKGEFEKWSRKHYTEFLGWPDKADADGMEKLHMAGLTSGHAATGPEAQAKLREVIEFMNFLNDFTLVPEREVGEVRLWKDYLVYAQLFGVADKVNQQLKKLFPADLERFANQYGLDSYALSRTIIYSNSISCNAGRIAAARTASAGKGGHTSFGGGGGFSGGGFGGGSR